MGQIFRLFVIDIWFRILDDTKGAILNHKQRKLEQEKLWKKLERQKKLWPKLNG